MEELTLQTMIAVFEEMFGAALFYLGRMLEGYARK